MKFTVLVDNKTENASCCAEWGLSILIETRGEKYLLDTGMSPMFIENAKAVGVDLSDVKALAISHGHFDHTGGVEAFIDINCGATVYLHEEALNVTYGVTDGVLDDYNCGVLWDDAQKAKILKRTILTKGVNKIGDNVWILGNIPDMDGFPMTDQFFKVVNPELKGLPEDPTDIAPDNMNHEQIMVVEENGKLHVFSGCSHKGIIPIITHVQNIFPGKPIAGITAGMHLYPVKGEALCGIINNLVELNLDYVVPLHCTGMNAIIMMKAMLGDKCRILCSGDSLEV